MLYRDHCRRIVRHEGGEAEWLHIPRHQCDNPRRGRLHRMLPDFLLPFKHYEETVVCDAIDGRLEPESSDDRPSRQSVRHWRFWIRINESDIDGYLKSIGHRELGFSEELLKSSVSLLSELKRSIPEGWLRAIIRFLYNSGAFLCPFYA